jgi:apolipoprotein N-acyltransferase
MRSAGAVVAVLSSAIIYTLCFPPYELHLIAPLALVPHFVAIKRMPPARAALMGALWGFASAWGITYWLPTTISVYYHQPYWLGLSLFSAATLTMVALEYAIASSLYAWASTHMQRGLPFFAAAVWTAAEFARAGLLTGNPWGFLGYSQIVLSTNASALETMSLALAQIADLGGVYTITFVLVAVNAAVAGAATTSGPAPTRANALLPALTLLVAALAYGGYRLDQDDFQSSPAAPTTRVAIIQPNLDLGSQWREELYGENLRELLEMTIEELEAHGAELVVWPENTMTFFVADEPLYRAAIARVLVDSGATLLAGAPHVDRESTVAEYFNSAFVLGPDGAVMGRYDKTHLLPFAEYFPLSSLELLNRSFGRVRQFSAGRNARLLDTPAGKAGVLICNETMFSSLAGSRVADGAELLVMLSNDSWVSAPMYGLHQLQMAVMRAIEQRRDVVRSSTSGPSAIINAHGHIQTVSEPQTPATLRGSISPRSYISPYSRLGDVFAWGCIAAVFLAMAVRRRSLENGGGL